MNEDNELVIAINEHTQALRAIAKAIGEGLNDVAVAIKHQDGPSSLDVTLYGLEELVDSIDDLGKKK